jgi:hypothetical protein
MLGAAPTGRQGRHEPQPIRNRTATGAVLTPGTSARTIVNMEPISIERDFTAFSVREGRLAPVTCVACGCRLERRADDTWWHFSGRGDRDARGCIVACAEQPHYGGVAAAIG